MTPPPPMHRKTPDDPQKNLVMTPPPKCTPPPANSKWPVPNMMNIIQLLLFLSWTRAISVVPVY